MNKKGKSLVPTFKSMQSPIINNNICLFFSQQCDKSLGHPVTSVKRTCAVVWAAGTCRLKSHTAIKTLLFGPPGSAGSPGTVHHLTAGRAQPHVWGLWGSWGLCGSARPQMDCVWTVWIFVLGAGRGGSAAHETIRQVSTRKTHNTLTAVIQDTTTTAVALKVYHVLFPVALVA